MRLFNANVLQQRNKNTYDSLAVKPALYTDNLPYLADVLSGKIHPADDLSCLENNLIVVKILEAASRSAKEGKKVLLN